jgi:hypothetical protein
LKNSELKKEKRRDTSRILEKSVEIHQEKRRDTSRKTEKSVEMHQGVEKRRDTSMVFGGKCVETCGKRFFKPEKRRNTSMVFVK